MLLRALGCPLAEKNAAGVTAKEALKTALRAGPREFYRGCSVEAATTTNGYKR